MPKVTIYGFWLTDPNAEGIGSHVYVTAADANSVYFKPMQTQDEYNGMLVQIAEPPAERPSEGKMSAASVETRGAAQKVSGAKAVIARPVSNQENIEILKEFIETAEQLEK